MAATAADLLQLCRLWDLDRRCYRRLFTSRVYLTGTGSQALSVTGPLLGAPYAVMVLENLVVWGARRTIFLGWCGAVSPRVRIGDIVVPQSAVIDEGTSCHYGQSDRGASSPSDAVVGEITACLTRRGIGFHAGTVWSTDAVYRETPEKIRRHQRNGVLAVEMEMSALFSVAAFRDVELGGLLVVSDELSSLHWRPGFREERFRRGRRTACSVVKELCQKELTLPL